jgi:hypothetical protein
MSLCSFHCTFLFFPDYNVFALVDALPAGAAEQVLAHFDGRLAVLLTSTVSSLAALNAHVHYHLPEVTDSLPAFYRARSPKGAACRRGV